MGEGGSDGLNWKGFSMIRRCSVRLEGQALKKCPTWKSGLGTLTTKLEEDAGFIRTSTDSDKGGKENYTKGW